MALPDWFTSLVDATKSLGSLGSPFGRSSPSTSLLTNPYHRFQSIDEVKASARLGVKIDVNRATVDDWLRLPGLSIRQAHALADLTKAGVHFYGLEDLAAALGCSLQQLKELEPILSFCYYDPESLQSVPAIPVNSASIELLIKVPAIDLFLAR